MTDQKTQAALFVALFVIAGVVAVCGTGTAVAKTIGETYREAEMLYTEGRMADSLEKLEMVLAMSGVTRDERIRAYELQASARIASGDRDGALQSLELILDTDPKHLLDPDEVSPGLMKVFYKILDDREELGAGTGIPSVAVLDLSNNSITDHDNMQALGQGLADALITELSGATEVRVLERERISYIRDEIGLNRSQEFDPQSAVQAGQLLGAHSFILGGYTRVKDKLRIDARLVKTKTGEVLKTHSIEGKLDDVFELVHDMAQAFTGSLGEVNELPQVSEAETASFDALIEYSKGLDRLDSGELSDAYGHFETSSKMAPTFAKAEKRMRQLQPLLASMSVGKL